MTAFNNYEDFIAARVQQLRSQKNISARKMSLSIGQNEGYITQIENKQNLPSMEGFLYICRYLEITPEEFFASDNQNPEMLRKMVHFTLGEGPQILIVHTHGSEAYSQSDGLTYQESDSYRTTDCTRNMVRVGEEMAQIFRENGFEVIHDTNLYDYPAYNGAYDRSGAAVKDWLAKYPSIKIILDVHRDALVGNDGSIYKLVSQENGEKVAQVMLVVGTDGGGASHPYWIDNLALAIRYQQELISDYVSLARPIVLRNSRYNQNLSTGSLLVEVGGHGNTLTEALAGARLFAQSVSQVLLGLKG